MIVCIVSLTKSCYNNTLTIRKQANDTPRVQFFRVGHFSTSAVKVTDCALVSLLAKTVIE